MKRLLLIMLILVAFTGCDRNGLEEGPCIAGTWHGATPIGGNLTLNIDLVISQEGNSLFGKVSFRTLSEVATVTDIRGVLAIGSRYKHPSTTFKVDWEDSSEELTVEGEVNESYDAISAIWGSYDEVVVTRQSEDECR